MWDEGLRDVGKDAIRKGKTGVLGGSLGGGGVFL
jgi:hypothetical protein